MRVLHFGSLLQTLQFFSTKEYLHHILLDAGFSVPITSLLLAALALLFAGGGLLAWRLGVHESLLFLIFMTALIGYVLLSRSVQRMVTSLRILVLRFRQNMTA